MKYKYPIIFVIIALLQFIAPVKMITDNQDVLDNGNKHKFIIISKDPFSPLVGRYLTLDFDNKIETSNRELQIGDIVYIVFKKDKKGFSQIKKVSKTKPNNDNFLKTSVENIATYSTVKDEIYEIYFKYPFNTFYYQEDKVKQIEEIIIENIKSSYALVYIKNGTGVLKDIIVNNESIKNILEK